MRFFLVFCFALLTLGVISPARSEAQGRATSYSFALSNHIVVDKKTSAVGFALDDVDGLLDNFRGERGMMLFVGMAGIALLAGIYGMPHSAMFAGIIAGGLLLINRPSMLALILVPMFLAKRYLKKKTDDEEDERPLVAGSGVRKRSRRRKPVAPAVQLPGNDRKELSRPA